MPLEAMANGAVFVNAKFKPPISRLNYESLSKKPSLRRLSSQSPYLEQIGEPYVYTVNFDDPVAFEEAIRKAVNKPVNALPEEYSPEGMLIRVHILISRDLCLDVPNWPPSSAFVVSLLHSCHLSNMK
ncbi:unnamed protein product [Cylicostephanus goldi]|uniref:alpha-1,6-mannosyl-glycoprotein 6-beta-N-acetylglucosaminyltransferase n=1 Tax=Cylicostephanus goldi TaxID=71465 RepID=A0A3P7R7U3_CYLGO|nr:unnamed protein product [Cylicostephanus goldi]